MDFSPVFEMDADSIPIHAPSTTSTDRSCSRYGQTPIVDSSVDDEEDQMREGVHADRKSGG